jgi:hypothetical protein
MYYYQEPNNRIQADIARRIGIIVLQYEQTSRPEKDDFSVTLHLCALQNLLTNCIELFKAMSKPARRELGLCDQYEDDFPWGVGRIEIDRNTFVGKLTVDQILRHIRNALSHPTEMDPSQPFTSTGYTSQKSSSESVTAISFASSPDTKKNRPQTWPDETDAEKYLGKLRSENKKQVHGVTVRSDIHGCFGLYHNGKPFAREFVCTLTTAQIRSLVLGLSNLLAHPAIEYWDGKTITNALAPAAA